MTQQNREVEILVEWCGTAGGNKKYKVLQKIEGKDKWYNLGVDFRKIHPNPSLKKGNKYKCQVGEDAWGGLYINGIEGFELPESDYLADGGDFPENLKVKPNPASSTPQTPHNNAPTPPSLQKFTPESIITPALKIQAFTAFLRVGHTAEDCYSRAEALLEWAKK